MSAVFKVPAPVGEARRPKRSLSPQPSTSSAPTPPAPLQPPLVPDADTNDVPDSVYSHVDKSIVLNEIGQLRGLRSGRRRGRWRRRLNQAKLATKCNEAIKSLEPIIMEEIVKQQSQHVLITSALDHFAKTVNGIVDKIEGKEPNEWTVKLELFKKKALELREKRRAKNPDAEEFQNIPPPLSAEETERSLREEIEAAIEALLTADKSKECLKDRFAHIVQAFKAIT